MMTMEKNSLVDVVLRNVALLFGFMLAALLMILGIVDHKKVLADASNPQRHAAATFFVIILVIYFVIFIVFAVVQCVDGFKLIFYSHQIAPLEAAPPPQNLEVQPVHPPVPPQP